LLPNGLLLATELSKVRKRVKKQLFITVGRNKQPGVGQTADILAVALKMPQAKKISCNHILKMDSYAK
jgi:hypothetical protein